MTGHSHRYTHRPRRAVPSTASPGPADSRSNGDEPAHIKLKADEQYQTESCPTEPSKPNRGSGSRESSFCSGPGLVGVAPAATGSETTVCRQRLLRDPGTKPRASVENGDPPSPRFQQTVLVLAFDPVATPGPGAVAAAPSDVENPRRDADRHPGHGFTPPVGSRSRSRSFPLRPPVRSSPAAAGGTDPPLDNAAMRPPVTAVAPGVSRSADSTPHSVLEPQGSPGRIRGSVPVARLYRGHEYPMDAVFVRHFSNGASPPLSEPRSAPFLSFRPCR